MGGALSQPTRQVNVSVLPTAIPEQIVVDVSALGIGDSLRLSDVEVPQGVELLDDPEGTVIATITAPISEEDLVPEGEEALEGELAEAAEGEEAGAAEGEEAPAEE
jgi:large subunit ribosomal protein L25